MALSSLLFEAGGRYSEAQLVVLVLAVLVVAVALLSYFVVAPEYEKRLEKQYAAAYAVHLDRDSIGSISSNSAAAHRYLALTRKKLTKHRSLGRWDIEAASSDDDAYDHHLQRLVASESDDEHHASSSSDGHRAVAPDGAPLSMNAPLRQSLTETQRAMLARRRKSESDALKHANVNRAEMLRRRVLLKKLEEEIKGAMKEHDASTAAAAASGSSSSSNSSSSASSVPTSMRGANDTLVLTPEKLQMLQDHPADCALELAVLAAAQDAVRHEELRLALQTLHDVLALYLSTDHRDMHKLTVFCNSLLQHDGLNHLRALELAVDTDVRALATSIIEMAVPSIWH